ncbi:protein SABRE-like [Actinidia eriantha]|uniref:protein SABRE-like n=1 Tax=Actinidia eriantha TaxID=165200 RepID=UPI00258AFCB0|nr:protein SABRE-like [Actinidia eriantha]
MASSFCGLLKIEVLFGRGLGGTISKAFEPQKPSPSRQYAQRKLHENNQVVDRLEMPQDDMSKTSSINQGARTPSQLAETSGSLLSPPNAFKLEKSSYAVELKSSLSYPAEDDEDVEEEANEVVPDGVKEVERARIELEHKELEQKLVLNDIRKLSRYDDATGDICLEKEGDLQMIIGGRFTLVHKLKQEIGNAKKKKENSIFFINDDSVESWTVGHTMVSDSAYMNNLLERKHVLFICWNLTACLCIPVLIDFLCSLLLRVSSSVLQVILICKHFLTRLNKFPSLSSLFSLFPSSSLFFVRNLNSLNDYPKIFMIALGLQ